MTLLLGMLGMVTSLTLLLAIGFAELRGRETLTTRVKQVEETQAAELKSTDPPITLEKSPDEILNTIDRQFNDESAID